MLPTHNILLEKGEYTTRGGWSQNPEKVIKNKKNQRRKMTLRGKKETSCSATLGLSVVGIEFVAYIVDHHW